MRKEAKIGLAVVIVLGGVFAFIVYKGMQPRDTASNSKVKEPPKRAGSTSKEKPTGGLLDRWNNAPGAAASSASDAAGQGTAGQVTSGQGGEQGAAAAAQAGDGQDPFAGRSTALDRYASRYDQNGAAERPRLSIYGDGNEGSARAGDDAGEPPAPLPDAGGEAVRRVSVYGPAAPSGYGSSTSADGGNPLRGDARSAAQNGVSSGQGPYDPPGGSYTLRNDADDPRDAYGRSTAAAQSSANDGADGAWRRSASSAGDRSDGYASAEQRSNTYGSNSYGKTGYAGSSHGTDGRSPYGPSQGGSSQYGSSQYGSSQYGSSQYGSSQYGSSQHASSSQGYGQADTGYGSSGYGRTSAAAAQPIDPVAPAPARRDGKYVVQPNDSCWLISRKLFGTGAYFKAIEEHNRHNYPRMDRLQVGDVLEVPTAEQLRAAYPDLCPKVRGQAPQGPRNYQVSATRRSGGGRVYVVQDGDNLFDIARYELGSAKRWVEIFDLNRELLSDDYDYLPVGAELILPDDGAGPADTVTERPGSPYAR